MTERKIAVIGGGAAGLVACGKARERGNRVILIEKNDIFGKKLRITGKGRCNITNAAEIPEIMSNITGNGKFLYSALYNFSNTDIVELLNSLGVPTKTERGGRVFPQSDKAKDVADALTKYALGKNAEARCERAKQILVKDGIAIGVVTDKARYEADSVILATGGASYPGTGSTGDGYKIAEQLGHTVVTPKPSLVPLETKQKWATDLMGLTLKNVRLTILSENGKELFSDFGEMLFTHFGISGPIVLSASCHMHGKQNLKAVIDLKPALTEEMLDKRLVSDFERFSKKHFGNSLDELLPKALIPVIIRESGIDFHKKTAEISGAERMRLRKVLKGLTLDIKGTRPIEEAIVTSGGIKVSEINPSTMESKLIKGLYFAGEIIDVDAYTGGYNLQIAFSTGALAGENA